MNHSKIRKQINVNAQEIERRRSKRIPILSSFAISLVIPKKGMHRLELFDVSENGIGFILNIEDEISTPFPIRASDLLEVNFYLNTSLFLPLSIRIVRVEDVPNSIRRVGADFENRNSESFMAFLTFLQFLDKIQSAAILTTNDHVLKTLE